MPDIQDKIGTRFESNGRVLASVLEILDLIPRTTNIKERERKCEHLKELSSSSLETLST